MRTALILTPLALLTACQLGGGPSDFGDVLPDDRLLVEVPDLSAQARGIGEPSEYAHLTMDITDDVNTGVHDVLRLISTITEFDPTWSDPEQQTALWGPWEDDGFEGQLWVQHTGAEAYTWALELRPAGDPDWIPVLAGEIEEGATPDSNKGRFALDFTAIDDMGGGDDITGSMVAEYELRPDGASATVYFGEILEDDGSIPQDAAYVFDHTDGMGGTMDVAVTEDVTDDVAEGGALELLIIRSRWDGDGAGRTDALVTGGDVGELVYTASECWSNAKSMVYYEDNFELVALGDESECAFGEADWPEE